MRASAHGAEMSYHGLPSGRLARDKRGVEVGGRTERGCCTQSWLARGVWAQRVCASEAGAPACGGSTRCGLRQEDLQEGEDSRAGEAGRVAPPQRGAPWGESLQRHFCHRPAAKEQTLTRSLGRTATAPKVSSETRLACLFCCVLLASSEICCGRLSLVMGYIPCPFCVPHPHPSRESSTPALQRETQTDARPLPDCSERPL